MLLRGCDSSVTRAVDEVQGAPTFAPSRALVRDERRPLPKLEIPARARDDRKSRCGTRTAADHESATTIREGLGEGRAVSTQSAQSAVDSAEVLGTARLTYAPGWRNWQTRRT